MRGLRDIFPIMVATVPFGIVFGALAAQQGLTLAENLLMSGLVYAGASQFVALQFWTHPLPFWTILASVLAVNLRHVLYSAAMGRKIGHWPVPARYAGFALLVDPTFALAELRGGPRLSVAYYFGIGVPLYLNWVTCTGIGALFGNLIADPQAIGLDFVVTAYFIFLIVGFRKRPNALPVIVASAAGSILAYLTAGPPWHFAGGAAAGMAIAAALAKPREAAT
ncbi:MAG TPA: AzlC family ABC transporter permease [Propylenella sp.]|nr:AzlC family ABC transporter permease [Propylenella sp.]